MGYYLFDNPPAIQQFHNPRRGKWTGGVLVHTAENVMDDVGPDTGAENIAAYIVRRNTYGSYHVLADSDSVIELLPPTAVAFHCAADGYNSTTVGVSYACRTVDLHPDSEWTKKATRNIATVLVRWWQDAGFDPLAARFIPAPETRVRLGLSTHGEAQPADRSDAWTRHPRRGELEALLLSEIAAIVKPIPPTPEEMERVSVIAVDDGTDPKSPPNVWWLTDGIEKRKLMPGKAGQEQAKQLVSIGLASNKRTADGGVQPIYLPYVLRGAKEV